MKAIFDALKCMEMYRLCSVAGLEMFFIEGGGGPQWGAPSAFFAFPNTVEANKAAQAILAQPCLGEALPGGKSASAAAGSILEVTLQKFDLNGHPLLRFDACNHAKMWQCQHTDVAVPFTLPYTCEWQWQGSAVFWC